MILFSIMFSVTPDKLYAYMRCGAMLEHSGGFCAGFPGSYLWIDAPGNEGGEGVQEHVKNSNVAEIWREHGDEQQ